MNLSCYSFTNKWRYYPVSLNVLLSLLPPIPPKVNPKNFGIRGDIDDITTQNIAESSKPDILGLLQEPYKNLQPFLVYEQMRNNKSSLKKEEKSITSYITYLTTAFLRQFKTCYLQIK